MRVTRYDTGFPVVGVRTDRDGGWDGGGEYGGGEDVGEEVMGEDTGEVTIGDLLRAIAADILLRRSSVFVVIGVGVDSDGNVDLESGNAGDADVAMRFESGTASVGADSAEAVGPADAESVGETSNLTPCGSKRGSL